MLFHSADVIADHGPHRKDLVLGQVKRYFARVNERLTKKRKHEEEGADMGSDSSSGSSTSGCESNASDSE